RAADGNAPVCGGNYIKTNYLDNDTIHNINNTDIAIGKFILPHEHRDANGNVILTSNDQITFITQQDIWNAIKKRNDFDNFVTSLLNDAIDCTAEPVTLDFSGTTLTATSGVSVNNLKTGRVPKSCLTPTLNENWQDNLLYAKCTSANCLTVNGGSCNGVVIFPGERNTSQARNTNTQKNTWSNYLEDTPSAANLTTFTTGATPFAGTPSFSGATVYLGVSPSTDIFACIPPPSPTPSP
ncbi:MAG: hypothetical protein Q7S51_00470, partial [Gallionellaceae bacterium]|nr:hypothetical protein [Gallionellaceae bacterium]